MKKNKMSVTLFNGKDFLNIDVNRESNEVHVSKLFCIDQQSKYDEFKLLKNFFSGGLLFDLENNLLTDNKEQGKKRRNIFDYLTSAFKELINLLNIQK